VPSLAVRRESVEMQLIRTLLAVLAGTTALATAPLADAQVPGLGTQAVAPCGTVTNGPDAGLSGATTSNCLGGGLIFNGPSIGRIETVIGPTIISPGFVGVIGVGGGSVFLGPGAGGAVSP
jgi:hypothetical protein